MAEQVGEFVHVGWIDTDRIHQWHPLGCRCSIKDLVHVEANEVYGKVATPSDRSGTP